MTRNYFFDLHPPFGRLLYTFLASLCGYQGNFTPDSTGESYITAAVPYLTLRCLSALLSTFTVSMVYLVLWESNCGVPACLTTAGLLVLDNAHIVQTRLIALDSVLCFSIVCSWFCHIKVSKLRDQAFSTIWWKWLFLTGFALSCTVSIKYVGVFTFFTVGVFVMIDIWRVFDATGAGVVRITIIVKHVLARFIALLLLPFAGYLLWF